MVFVVRGLGLACEHASDRHGSEVSLRHDYVRAAVVGAAPYFAVVVGYLTLRYVLFDGLTFSPLLHTSTDPMRLALNGGVYVVTTICPWGLEELKPAFRTHPLAGLAVLGGAAIAGAGAVWLLRRELTKGDIAAAALLLVGIAPVARLYSPWNAYLPAAGGALLLASCATLAGLNSRRPVGVALLGMWIGAGAVFSVSHAQTWREAGHIVDGLLDAIEAEQALTDVPIVLANLPVELDGAPVFGGNWGLEAALRNRGLGVVLPLSFVHLSKSSEEVYLTRSEKDVVVALGSDGSFYRLPMPEIQTRSQFPRRQSSYTSGAWTITVESVNAQGAVDVVRLSCPEDNCRGALRVFANRRLVEPAPYEPSAGAMAPQATDLRSR